MALEDTLAEIAKQFKAVQDPVPANQSALATTFRITLPVAVTEIISGEFITGYSLKQLIETLTYVPDKPVDLDLDFLAKNVRFVDASTAANTLGGMPVVDPPISALPPGTVMFGDLTSPGVPGVLGKVKGTIKLPVEQLVEEATQLPLAIKIRWTLADETNTAPPGVQYPDGTGGFIPFPGTLELDAPEGTYLNLRLPIEFTELTQSIAPPVHAYTLKISIQLTATPPAGPAVTSGWIDLPAIPLNIPIVPFPTIVVLFEHANYQGRALIIVPGGSVVADATGAAGALSVADAMNLALTALKVVAPQNAMIGFLAGSTGRKLTSLASSAGSVLVASSSLINDLSAYVFDPGWGGVVGRVTAEDIASSFIIVGREGTRVRMSAVRNMDPGVTPMTVDIGSALHIAVSSLDNPQAMTIVPESGGAITDARANTNFNEKLSSVEITKA